METRTDTELIAEFAGSGNEPFNAALGEKAFAELVNRHQKMVFRTCLRMLGNPQDTQDATQATFIVLMNKAVSLKREGDLGGWLHAVARRVSLKAIQQRAVQARSQEAAALAMECEDTVTPEAAALVEEFLDTEIERLSSVQRQAVVLRYLEGHSQESAAQLAGCPLGTMKRRASDGIEKLRTRLTKRGVALSGVALAGLLTSEASAAIPETRLPSILAAVKTVAATGAAATATTTKAVMLAKGAMKAMFIAKVKMAAAVAAAVIVTGTAVPVGLALAQAAGVRNEGAAPRAITATAENEKVMPRAGVARMADKTRMKMEAIVIPELDFQQASIHDVVEFLQEASVMFDKSAGDQGAKGVNLIVRLGQEDAPLITLSARYISLLDALKMVTDLANLTYAITDEGVEVSRKKDRTGKKQDGTDEPSKRSVDLGKMSQRTYTISPLAATALAGKTGGGTDNEKIKQMFVNLGIAFPPGSAVTYLPSSRELIARNSAENLEAVENSLAKLLTLADDEDLKEKMSRRRQ